MGGSNFPVKIIDGITYQQDVEATLFNSPEEAEQYGRDVMDDQGEYLAGYKVLPEAGGYMVYFSFKEEDDNV
jgi:hypothetical protein